MNPRIILDLCSGTGAWSEPYKKKGYHVIRVTLPDCDVRDYVPPSFEVWGVLAAPPCTEFAVSGARWWKEKAAQRPHLLQEAVEIVQACRRIAALAVGWWALENPVGRLTDFIGDWRYTWQPWQYGDPWYKRSCMWGSHVEPLRTVRKFNSKGAPVASGFRSRNGKYKNRMTALNAAANSRHNNPAEYFQELLKRGELSPDWIHRLGPSPNRAVLRSITPPGFAQAFCDANP